MLTEAGQQLRILQEIKFVKGSKQLVSRISDLNSQETAEVQRIVRAIGDEWGTCDLGFGEVGLQNMQAPGQDTGYFPVPFRADALHKARVSNSGWFDRLMCRSLVKCLLVASSHTWKILV